MKSEKSRQFKKQAFRNQIRREWLQNHFSSKRKEFLQQSPQQEFGLTCDYFNYLESLMEQRDDDRILCEYEKSSEAVAFFVRDHIGAFAKYCSENSYKRFCIFTSILEDLSLRCPERQKEVIEVCLTKVLRQLQKLSQSEKIRQPEMESKVISLLIPLTDSLLYFSPIQTQEVCALLLRALKSNRDALEFTEDVSLCHEKLTLISVCLNRMITTKVSEEFEDKLELESRQQSLELIRFKVTNHIASNAGLFLTCLMEQVLRVSGEGGSGCSAIRESLRLMVNLTFEVDDEEFYRKAFQSQVQMMTIHALSLPKSSQEVVILTARLVNNMLCSSRDLTELHITSMHLSLFVKELQRADQHRNTPIVGEISSVFANIFNFGRESALEYLFKIKAHCALIDSVEHLDPRDFEVFYGTTCAIILLQHQFPDEMSNLIRDRISLFRDIAENSETDSHLVQLLEAVIKKSQELPPHWNASDRLESDTQCTENCEETEI